MWEQNKKSFYLDSPIGVLRLEFSEKGLCRLNICEKKEDAVSKIDPIFTQASQELSEYFRGIRRVFSIPLDITGSNFQMQVWRQLRCIPYGESRSYEDLAKALLKPKAARAIGQANHHNPIMIIIPCHRVIGKNNKLTGYAAGLDVKRYLLKLEGIQFSE